MSIITRRVVNLHRSFFGNDLRGRVIISVRAAETASQNASKQQLHHQKLWDIRVAVCLERVPVISSLRREIEEKYAHLQESLEVEHSVLSDMEVKLNQEQAKSKPKGKKKMSEKEEQIVLEAQRELAKMKETEDAIEDMKKTFPLGSRKTPSDKIRNTHSAARLLDAPLYLLLSDDQQPTFSFPEGTINQKETLRQAAERILLESFPAADTAQFLSNAPAGVVSLKYSPDSSQGAFLQGCKVFFYKASLTLDPRRSPEMETAKWLAREELAEQLRPDYVGKVLRFL